ncbi:MAG: NADH-quinone oxidoreductase subunit A [Candidatus Melainabacteria bacterium]|nr:NADH-quinone oxidoreductase subunit A [Candidatus Melainabacteria bacterium]MBI3308754.1 NADH-quinone oxidoreductase subunit A [Candidatus Melainabacteria bacterium]
MTSQVIQIAIFTAVGFILGGVLLTLSLAIQKIFGISNPTKVKKESYECGMKAFHDTFIQYDVKYYLFALIFIIFDVEFVFLVPWAVIFDIAANKTFLIIEAFIFVFILVLGLIYAWGKGVLEFD